MSPDGKRLAYVKNRGELVVTGLDKNNPKTLFVSDVRPWYEWSPDGKWMVVQAKDSHDNWDIWILSTDSKTKPYNLSRHPDWDGGPRWSPDGKLITFVGRRGRDDEMDLHYVYLSASSEVRSERATKLLEAENTLRSSRVSKPKPVPEKKTETTTKPEEKEWAAPEVRIEFDDLSKRVKRIALPNSKETDPFWHSASKKMGFTSDYKGERGTYYVVFPGDFTPRMISKTTGSLPIWKDNKLHWMVDNQPARLMGTSLRKYTFKSYQDTDREEYLKLGYRIIWRNLRDYYYDKKMNGKDWDLILKKYESHIHANIDLSGYVRLVLMMFGELNSSHLFFEPKGKTWDAWSSDNGWRRETVHLGLRFEPNRKMPGLRIRDVVSGGPCDHPEVGVKKGDVLIAINDTKINSNDRICDLLNGRLSQALELTFQIGAKKKTISIEPINYYFMQKLYTFNFLK